MVAHPPRSTPLPFVTLALVSRRWITAAPPTISAVGYFVATRARITAGEATLRMTNATAGRFSLGGHEWKLKADPEATTYHGTGSGSVVDLKIVNRNNLTGTI